MVYSYDANGNTTSKTKGGITTSFLFDIRDQLGEVRQASNVLGRYGYDYQGRRILKIGDDGRRQYTYDQLSVITEADQVNNTVSKYDYGMDQLVRLDNRGEGRSFFHLDGLRSTVGLTDAAGGSRQSIFYDAWGNERDRIGASANNFTFTGHELDEETGLIYAKARFYDPDIGRFLTQDTFLGASDRPPSLHRYFYSFSNPLRFYDPDGFAPRTAEAMLQQRIDEIHQQTGTPKQLIALSLAGHLAATGIEEEVFKSANALTLGGAGGIREGLEEGDISARQGFFESVYATGASFLSGNANFILPGVAEYRAARQQGAGVGEATEAGVGGAFAVPELQVLFGGGRTAGERFDAATGVAFKGLRLFVIGKLFGTRGGASSPKGTVVTEGLQEQLALPFEEGPIGKSAPDAFRSLDGESAQSASSTARVSRPDSSKQLTLRFNVGDTESTQQGKTFHERSAGERRASGQFDLVNERIADASGNRIDVPARVDLRTGEPIEAKGTQSAQPDAVSFSRRLIVEDKPLTRDISKDRQQIIRFIRAYEAREGILPDRIAIQRYDPRTGLPVRTDIFTPSDFLPSTKK